LAHEGEYHLTYIMASLRPSHRGASRSWEVTKSHRGLYSGGKVALFSPAGKPVLACLYNDDVALIDAASGQVSYHSL
jgi:hypothetical protein